MSLNELPRTKSLHSSFLLARELGRQVLASDSTWAWTHPDDDWMWHLTSSPEASRMAEMAAKELPGVGLRLEYHGIAGQTHGGAVLWGFRTEAFEVSTQTVQLGQRLSVAALSLPGRKPGQGQAAQWALHLDAFAPVLEDLDADERGDLLEDLQALHSLGAKYGFPWELGDKGAIVQKASGGFTVHPVAWCEQPF
jgi:hypothetical protein